MSTYFQAVETDDVQVHILTKTKWLYIFPMPHTSVTPQKARDLKSLGAFIKWTTADPTTLDTLHNAIVRLVKEVGISGFVEIANSIKMTQQVSKTFSGSTSGFIEIMKQASREGNSFPVPEEVLKYIKTIM